MVRKVKLRIDPLIVLICLGVVLGIVAPISGTAAEHFRFATKLAIALLFFLYGARLSTREALQGLAHWRLHLTILAFTYLVFPLVGQCARTITPLLGPELAQGVMYLSLVPSTVQSSVAFTSIAGGNVAGAIVAASASNLVGVFATPVLVMLLMQTGGVAIDATVFGDIALQLLAPFVLGQLLRPWCGRLAASPLTKSVDRGSIGMVVYSAFSAGMVGGVWSRLTPGVLATLVVGAAALCAAMLWLTLMVAKLLHFERADAIAIQFCGTKKSLASGLPMAAVIFGGAQLGLLIVPLMIYHQVQLMMCSALAGVYSRRTL